MDYVDVFGDGSPSENKQTSKVWHERNVFNTSGASLDSSVTASPPRCDPRGGRVSVGRRLPDGPRPRRLVLLKSALKPP